ncbi:ribosomal protein L6 family [Striga asiatica]|uniref:Ribosomal protein L6 family n=1 Tax=Striga asiatica TaxID=4170 RepID=A0A5A7PA46_STRAF|nr:ribosomal protein L6 family [Striga asiatica]
MTCHKAHDVAKWGNELAENQNLLAHLTRQLDQLNQKTCLHSSIRVGLEPLQHPLVIREFSSSGNQRRVDRDEGCQVILTEKIFRSRYLPEQLLLQDEAVLQSGEILLEYAALVRVDKRLHLQSQLLQIIRIQPIVDQQLALPGKTGIDQTEGVVKLSEVVLEWGSG